MAMSNEELNAWLESLAEQYDLMAAEAETDLAQEEAELKAAILRGAKIPDEE